MLETILQSINSNLERMAKAQEESLNFMKGLNLPKTINAKEITNNGESSVGATPQPVVEQQPVIPQMPTAQPVMSQPQMTIPTTQVQESFTQDQLAVAMSRAVSAGKMNIIQGILQQFGVQALNQINPSDYNKVASMLKEAGVEI